MKRLLLFTIILFQLNALMAQFHLGGYGGYSRSSYTGDTPPDEIYGWSGGFLMGLTSSYDITKIVSLELDANLAENNAAYQVFDDRDDELKVDSAELKLLALGIPLGVMVKGKNNRFYVKSGFEFQFPLSAKAIRVDSEIDLLDQIKDVCLAFQFGLGYIVPIGNPNLVFEFNYTQGISNLTSDKFNERGDYHLVRTKLQGLRFKLGIEFPLGNKLDKKSSHD